MPIPTFDTVMPPFLRYAKDGNEHAIGEAREALAQEFKLTDEERRALLSSGKGLLFNNRVGWARTFLKKAGLIEYTRRGHFRITDRGLDLLRENPAKIDPALLKRYPEFLEFQSGPRRAKDKTDEIPTSAGETETPEEALERHAQELRTSLANDLLEQILKSPPQHFERLVVDLLVKMGYGGSLKDAGEAIGKSGDEGIDGTIKEDRLGLDVIYIQAKRWKPASTIGRPEVQRFSGALSGQRAKKGVFITTTRFSKDAEAYALNHDPKIILIDGDRLTDLMIDYNIGVAPVQTYELKRLDSDYFTEE